MGNKDWMPSKKEEQLLMAKTWITIIEGKQRDWNIPSIVATNLSEAQRNAEVEISVPTAERNKISGARLTAAFTTLKAEMRDIKKRYFYVPPLTDADLISLGLKPRDTIPTPVGDPVGLVTAMIKYPNEGALELTIKHVEGSPFDKRANYGVSIKYGIFPVDAPHITDVNQLTESIFTRRKKELLTFDKKDRSKKAVFCLRYENSKGKAGQWGPIVAAVIP